MRLRGTRVNLSKRNILMSTGRGDRCLWSDLVMREEASPIKHRPIRWNLLIKNDICITRRSLGCFPALMALTGNWTAFSMLWYL